MVTRRLDQILWSETQASGDFWKVILNTYSTLLYLVQWLQKESFLKWREWLQGPPQKFLQLPITWTLFLQASLWSYLSPKANGMVVRHVDQILWSQTQASGDFWNFMLTEPSPINYLKSRKSWKTSVFFFFYRSRERKKCLNILYQILKVVKYLGEGLCKISWP